MRTLDFTKEQTHTITLDELQSSGKEILPGDSYQNGIRHIDLLMKVQALIHQFGLQATNTGIIVSSAGSNKFSGATMEEKRCAEYGDKAVESYVFRRLLSKFDITSLQDNETIMSVAISYHQQGIQIGIGPNVKICSNMSIMSSEFLISTYGGKDKMPGAERMLEVLATWLNNAKYIRNRDIEIMNQMKSISVQPHEVSEIIGDMCLRRIRKDKFKTGVSTKIPLTQSQINKFGEAYLKMTDENTTGTTLWDLYNLGTNFHKADYMDLTSILDQNVEFGKMLMAYYNVNTVYNINTDEVKIDRDNITDVSYEEVKPEAIEASAAPIIAEEDEW